MDEISVREANATDAPFLCSLAREAYREVVSLQHGQWDEAVHGARFAAKVARLPFWVAELDGEPVGAVSSSVRDGRLFLDELLVLPAFQSRGIGSFLLLREIDRARRLGLPLHLHTLRLNRALRFYERHGFVVTARGDVYIDLEWTA